MPNESRENVLNKKVIPHLYFFTPKTLERISREAGFEVVATRVLGIAPLRTSIFSEVGKVWLRQRWQARYDAKGRLNLLTFLPFFGRFFKEDRYFKKCQTEAAMLRVYLKKSAGPIERDKPLENRELRHV